MKRAIVLLAAVTALVAIDLGVLIASGLPKDRVISSVLPALLKIAIGGWVIFYPALLAWREYQAGKGSTHISEPDFEARVPVVEPVVSVLTLLPMVLFVWLGGYATQGIAYVLGALSGLAFGIAFVALGAVLTVRPIAREKMRTRALRQYFEAGLFHLNKGNAKRARRLLERAFEEAKGTPQANEIAKHVKAATLQEAEELRQKGHSARADELIRAQSSREGMELLVGWDPVSEEAGRGDGRNAGFREDDDSANARDVVASPPKPPVLLEPSDVRIDFHGRSANPVSVDEAAIRERARILEKRGRAREAMETLLSNGLFVTPLLAQEAIKDYIAQGMLRSADAIYEALGERQIPEFYQAVAAEWARETEGEPPSEACLRIARILVELGADEPAARVACRGALSKAGDEGARAESSRLASDLCRRLGMEPPVELLEAMGDAEAAARAYEQEGRAGDAFRCYCKFADDLIAKKEAPGKLIPVLSKIFLLDPGAPDAYLEPLARHVLESNAAGPTCLKILVAYRRRRKPEERLSARLFELFVDAQQSDEAFQELETLAKIAGSNSDLLIRDYRIFVDRFPDHAKARAQYIRVLLKMGRVDDAAAQVHLYLSRSQNVDLKETVALLELLLDWGHSDNALRKTLGMLRIKNGNAEGGLSDLERYAREGGREPEALALARSMLSENLALASGSPNHGRLLRLARFLVFSGDPTAAITHLEVCRASQEQKSEADLLLSRALIATGSSKRALVILKEAIAGRSIGDTLELHFELARAYEALGSAGEARKIDRAIAEANPDFRSEYEKQRPRSDIADTAWVDAHADGEPDTESSTAPIAAESAPPPSPRPPKLPRRSDPARETTEAGETPAPQGVKPPSPQRPENEEEAAKQSLGDALLPRYRLLRRLGAGGMGEVHLAEDVDLGRYVAIKVLRRSLATDLFLAKFREEARIVAQLAHPNIVSIYDLGQKGNWSYIVMEYVDGSDLASLVNKSKGFERRRLIRIVATVAEAMDYAHSRGVVHRDLKPANILVGPGDIAKVTDFGIAKVLQPDGKETAFSAAGLQVGTVNYMAPEQINGAEIDGRTDQYLLGTTLYVCLTGSFPYSGNAIVFQKLRQDAAPMRSHVPSISPDLDACVLRCLARRPEDRFQSMAEFSEVIRRVPEARAKAP